MLNVYTRKASSSQLLPMQMSDYPAFNLPPILAAISRFIFASKKIFFLYNLRPVYLPIYLLIGYFGQVCSSIGLQTYPPSPVPHVPLSYPSFLSSVTLTQIARSRRLLNTISKQPSSTRPKMSKLLAFRIK